MSQPTPGKSISYLRRLEALEEQVAVYKAKCDSLENWKEKIEKWIFENFEVKFENSDEDKPSTEAESIITYGNVQDVDSRDTPEGSLASYSSTLVNGDNNNIPRSSQINGDLSHEGYSAFINKILPPVVLTDVQPMQSNRLLFEPISKHTEAQSRQLHSTVNNVRRPQPLILPKVEQSEPGIENISISAVRSLQGIEQSSNLNGDLMDSNHNNEESVNVKNGLEDPSIVKNSLDNIVTETETLDSTHKTPLVMDDHQEASTSFAYRIPTAPKENGSFEVIAPNNSESLGRHIAGEDRLDSNSCQEDDEEISIIYATPIPHETYKTNITNFLIKTSPIPNGRPHTPQSELDDVPCSVCTYSIPEAGNEMVFCDKCNVCVHQACYGIFPIPKGTWLCNPCRRGLNTAETKCYFCPQKGGALKPVKSPAKTHWAHVCCALWIPEVKLANTSTMEPVINIQTIDKGRWKLKCSICNIKMGACIQCMFKRCPVAFHVTCAIDHGIQMDWKMDDALSQGCSLQAFCTAHSENWAKPNTKRGSNKRNSPKKQGGTPKKKRKTVSGDTTDDKDKNSTLNSSTASKN